jgi:hypothetical protein
LIVAGVHVVVRGADCPAAVVAPISQVATPVVLRNLVSAASDLCSGTALRAPLTLVGPAKLASTLGLLTLSGLLPSTLRLLPAGLTLSGLLTSALRLLLAGLTLSGLLTSALRLLLSGLTLAWLLTLALLASWGILPVPG